MTATEVRPEAAPAAGPAYAAFVSYSRAVDGRLAPRLENSLERFATPWYRLRAFRVFRDDSSLSTNPGLWSSLTSALDRAQFFVLLASPGSAASEWVGREVAYWLEHRDRDRLLIVLTDGEIAWDERTGDFDWERTTALPRELAGVYGEEPRYTDLRFAAHSDHLSLRDPRFRAAVADVAAPLHGRAKDDLIGEEVRQHRRTLRIARAAGVSLALLAIAASAAAVLAVRSADRANRERDRAEREARVATSRQLAAQSTVALRDGRLPSALEQAARAWATARTGESRGAVLAALKAAPGLVGVRTGPPGDLAAISGDRRRVALLGRDDRVTVLDLATGRRIGEPLAIRRGEAAGLALDPQGTSLAVGYGDGSVDLWDLERGDSRRLAGPAPATGAIANVYDGAHPAFAADRPLLAWGGPGDKVSVWDGRRVRRLPSPAHASEAPKDVAISADGRYVAMAGAESDKVALWRLGARDGPPRMIQGRGATLFSVKPGEHGAIALGPGRRPRLAIGGADDGRVDLWDAASGRKLTTLAAARHGRIDSLTFSPDGALLTVVDPAGLTVWTPRGTRIARFPAAGAERGAAPLDDRGRIAAVGAGGEVMLRDGSDPQLARELLGVSDFTPEAVAFDRAGRRIAALDRRERVRMWPAAGGAPAGPPLSPALEVLELDVLPDGRVAACCGLGADAGVRVWGPEPGEPPSRAAPEVKEADDVAVTPEGQLVVSEYDDPTYRVRGPGRPLELKIGDQPTRLSDDGRWAAVGTDEGWNVWSVADRRRAASLPAGADVAFSPTGRLVAVSGDDGVIRLADRVSGRSRGSLGADLEVAQMAFSPDGRWLATIADHGRAGDATVLRLELWDVADPARAPDVLNDVGGQALPFETDLAFSPDGRRLVAVGVAPQPLVFDVDPEVWAKRACRLGGC